MGVILTMAYRNLREHRTKTLIIGSLVAIGLVVLVVGNSLIDTSEAGVRALYTENFTGDIAITAAGDLSPSLFALGGGAARLAGTAVTPVIERHPDLMAYLESLPWVAGSVSQAGGIATAEVEGEGSTIVQLFGVDPGEYLAMFPDTIRIVRGRFIEGDEEGIVLSEAVAASLAESVGHPVAPGDRLLLRGSNAVSGTKIREVVVRGIIGFPREAPNLSLISYVDLTTLRVLLGMNRVTDVAVDLAPSERASLGGIDESDLFGGGDLVQAAATGSVTGADDEYLDVLGDTSDADLYRAVDPDAYDHVLLRLAAGTSASRSIAALNAYFERNDLPVRAWGWVDTAGQMATIVSSLKVVFNLLILVVAVVAVIIIMNTLVISVTERMGEIGTMRAIGAQRSFVRALITVETLMITLVFGTAGIAAGVAALLAIGGAGVRVSGVFLQVLFGGEVIRPVISGGSLAASLAMVLAVGALASLYPVAVALKVPPVRAMSRQ
jgi:putative ABC transport system permease protein